MLTRPRTELTRIRTEQVLADAACRRPELLPAMADMVTPDEFEVRYLGEVFAAALAAYRRGATGFAAVHEELAARGVHDTDADVVTLYTLGGVGEVLPSLAGVDFAAMLVGYQDRERVRLALVAALESMERPTRLDAVAARAVAVLAPIAEGVTP